MKELRLFVLVMYLLIALSLFATTKLRADQAEQCIIEQFILWDAAPILELCRKDQHFITESGEKFFCGKVAYL